MKKIYKHFSFWGFMTISIIILIYLILNIQTIEEYKIEFERLQIECDARTPEGYYCFVDYYPESPYWLL